VVEKVKPTDLGGELVRSRKHELGSKGSWSCPAEVPQCRKNKLGRSERAEPRVFFSLQEVKEIKRRLSVLFGGQ
jgi:hypothetical protein